MSILDDSSCAVVNRHHSGGNMPSFQLLRRSPAFEGEQAFKGHTLNLGGGQTRRRKTIRRNHSKERGTQQQSVEEVPLLQVLEIIVLLVCPFFT